jgi:hypothetical protein
MTDPKADSADVKSSAANSISVEYLPETMDEIRQYALHGLMRLRVMAQGGMELGGVLYGVRGESALRIKTWRPIECEHAMGPGFQLSDRDAAILERQLRESESNPDLSGMKALGWFVSHTQAGGLTGSDIALFDRFFPQPWQFTLLLQPHKESASKAAFYVREEDGTLRSGPSRHSFIVEPLSAGSSPAKVVERMQVLEPPRTRLPDLPDLPAMPELKMPPIEPKTVEAQTGESRLPVTPEAVPTTAPPTSATPTFPTIDRPRRDMFTMEDTGGGRQIWVWAFLGLLLVVVGVLFAWKPAKPARSIAFHVADSGGQLLLQWDRNAAPVLKAVRGTVDIKDGATFIQLPLDPARLKEGTLRYTRKSGDQEVVMSVYPTDGPPVQESARFVGPPPAQTTLDETEQLRKQRDDLAAEVTKLKEQLKAETARREKLEAQGRTPPAPAGAKKRAAAEKPRAKKRKPTKN